MRLISCRRMAGPVLCWLAMAESLSFSAQRIDSETTFAGSAASSGVRVVANPPAKASGSREATRSYTAPASDAELYGRNNTFGFRVDAKKLEASRNLKAPSGPSSNWIVAATRG